MCILTIQLLLVLHIWTITIIVSVMLAKFYHIDIPRIVSLCFYHIVTMYILINNVIQKVYKLTKFEFKNKYGLITATKNKETRSNSL